MWRAALAALLLAWLPACPGAVQRLRAGASRDAVFDVDALTLAEEPGRASMLQAADGGGQVVSDLDDAASWGGDDAGDAVGTTLDPIQRVQAHFAKYEKDIVVELNMTEAHETGKLMGIALKHDVNFEPAKVATIHKTGLIEEWNKKHPNKAVHVGDEVVAVNSIQWHANTETFVTRIVGQFKAGRKRLDGTDEVFRLYLQRPKPKDSEKRYLLQRVDAHTKAYSTEFEARVAIPDRLAGTMDEIMGWEVAGQQGPDGAEEWMPAIINKIEESGPVAAWNKEHPDQLFLEGDEILHFDAMKFHHNSTEWMRRINQHWRSEAAVDKTNRSVLIRVQRPRWIQEAFDELHPVQEIASVAAEQHSVNITFPQANSALHLLGWQIAPSGGANASTSATVVTDIRPRADDRRPGPRLVAALNAERPGAIAAGDLIVGVNGVPSERFDKARDFYAVVSASLQSAARKGGSVSLTLERPSQKDGVHMRPVRLNMEHGVHMKPEDMEHFRRMRTTSTTEPPPLPGPDGAGAAGAAADGAGAAGAAAGDDDDDGVIGATEDGPEDVPQRHDDEGAGARGHDDEEDAP